MDTKTIEVICPCGNKFQTKQCLVKVGKGKFCSKSCKYKFRIMPKRGKGTYKLVNYNSGQFEKGIRYNTETEFKKGDVPWNKDTKGIVRPNSGSFKEGHIPANYKGDEVGYYALHSWVTRNKGNATTCEHCGYNGYTEWANVSREYKRELDDFMSLCKVCHIKYDREGDNWGKATKRFININSKNKDKIYG